MATSYSSWTVAKLTKERDKIDKAIAAKSGKERKALLAKIKKIAAAGGHNLADLLDGSTPAAPAGKVRKKRVVSKKKAASKKKVSKKKVSKKKASKKKAGKKRGPAPQVFRNPKDHSETWSGRGRPPLWVVDHINGGGDKEDLRFK